MSYFVDGQNSEDFLSETRILRRLLLGVLDLLLHRQRKESMCSFLDILKNLNGDSMINNLKESPLFRSSRNLISHIRIIQIGHVNHGIELEIRETLYSILKSRTETGQKIWFFSHLTSALDISSLFLSIITSKELYTYTNTDRHALLPASIFPFHQKTEVFYKSTEELGDMTDSDNDDVHENETNDDSMMTTAIGGIKYIRTPSSTKKKKEDVTLKDYYSYQLQIRPNEG
ncbi:hypothetical protein POM88_029349 [Heracleum sosnowskyi]|uniref:Uncharacterized protein n=1 Tax=Heracleum sosnowskyi TaxID=360622 RepID=A0AAD8MH60_9APIA|nr:hypothetical protein POM88_029349 [Heracleum sosnowskyi]